MTKPENSSIRRSKVGEQRTTTHAVRTAIQRSQVSLVALSRKFWINLKTVEKWGNRATVEDMKTRPFKPRSTVFIEAEEAMVLAFRRHNAAAAALASVHFSRPSCT